MPRFKISIMKILKIIHGYPPEYNAGSEVYSQSICNELTKNNEVILFSREENEYEPDFKIRKDTTEHGILHYRVNMARSKDGYNHPLLNERFGTLVEEIKPDIAHIGHLNHLSIGIIDELHSKKIPILFTLHDFWLMCPRGQFLQRNFEGSNQFKLCEKQEDNVCPDACYKMYFSGIESDHDKKNWEKWITMRMETIRALIPRIDMFHAPSKYLMQRFVADFGIPGNKIIYMDYGFPTHYLTPVAPKSKAKYTFGYIGTHIPAKGINLLIEAFSKIEGSAELKIFGRTNGQNTNALKKLAATCANNVEFCGEYINKNLAETVFNTIDVIVVPSIWAENSPLVIHEAQACRIPVITADFGGMAELVQHKVNGLLFTHRDCDSLAKMMQHALSHLQEMREYGKRGYLNSTCGDVQSIEEHCTELTSIYKNIIASRRTLWRITIDTNPEDCNLHCIMCEEHSEYSNFKRNLLKKTGKLRRVMPEEWIQRIIEEAKELGVKEIIPTTMGDPLVSKGIDTITSMIRKSDMKLNITHNGTFPGKSIEQWATQLIPITKDIKISWNGASCEVAESVMKGLNYLEAVNNLRELIKYRDQHFLAHHHYCQITLQLTFMRSNMHEIEKIIQLAATVGVDRIKGHHLWVHFPELATESFNYSSVSVEEWNKIVEKAELAVKRYKRKKDGTEIRLENFHPFNKEQSYNVPDDYECPFLEKELWISATGKISPCCAPDELRNGLGEFGNIQTQTLKQVILSKPYNELVTNYKTNELCKKCQMRRPSQN